MTHLSPSSNSLAYFFPCTTVCVSNRVGFLQVAEQRRAALELRALLSTSSAGIAFERRCDVREAVMNFLRDEMPEALPRGRHLLAGTAAGKPVALSQERLEEVG